MKTKIFFLGMLLLFSACTSSDDGSDPMKDATPMNNTTSEEDATPTEEAFSLEGIWVRTSTVPADLEGMQVALNEDLTEATIISVGVNSFGFSVGEVKWKSILKKNADSFDFEDLGRDMQGNSWYAEGVITKEGPDEISLSINNSVAGNEQAWERMK